MASRRAASGRSRYPPPEYRVEATFRAPLEYVFRWCTDFGPSDAKLEGEKYTRKVISRDEREVIFEDLQAAPTGGWRWSRQVVHLDPPRAWHMDGFGSHRKIHADYRLSELGDGRTRLELRARRAPSILPFHRIPRSEWEPEVTTMWQRFSRALERDFRQSRSRRR